jgi:hypothetical protein
MHLDHARSVLGLSARRSVVLARCSHRCSAALFRAASAGADQPPPRLRRSAVALAKAESPRATTM